MFDGCNLTAKWLSCVLLLSCLSLSAKKDILKDSLYTINSTSVKPEFTTQNILVSPPVSDDRRQAKTTFDVLEESESWVDNFSNEDIQRLPVGVKHNIDNIEYAIGILNAKITPEYTEITVFGRVRLPQTNENGYPIELFFGANNVKLSHEGGIIGDAKLVLLGDMYIPFNAGKWMLTLKGGFDYRSGQVQDKTYVTIGCDGIKEMAIQGAVEFSRDLVLPVESNGEVLENKTTIPMSFETENGTLTKEVPYRVRGDFNVIASDWNDILVSISLQPFTLTKKRNNTDYNGNFQFYVNQAVLDFSDLRNAPAVSFPSYYHENGLLLPNQQTWRGVYVNTIDVRLPKEFKTNNSIQQNGRVGFGAHHLIVDNNGVSGTFYADNIFPLDEGITNEEKAWAYSLDHVEVSLAANTFIGAGFNGRIVLPVSKQENANEEDDSIGLQYTGLISPEEYLLNVATTDTIDFNLWSAKGQLLPNSSIELAVREGQFRPKAVLHGGLYIGANRDSNSNSNKKLVDFPGIEFQNLVLQTESPVFAVDYMGYTGEVKFGNFPATISNIGITANAQAANLYFDLDVNLMGGQNGFAAGARLAVLGQFEEADRLQKWRFNGLDLGAIYIDADLSAFHIWGSLELMDDDPTYGDGFAATLGGEFKSLQATIEVNAIFGKTDFRYWMVDAAVDLPPGTGTGTGTGVVNLAGFAGGASYHMHRQDFSTNSQNGAFTYVPNKETGLGVKAMVLLNIVDDTVLKGGAGFEVLFNNHGGINQMGIYGQVSMFNVNIPGMDGIASALNKFNENATAKAKFLGVDGESTESSFVGRNLLDKAENEFIKTPPSQLTMSAILGITYDFQNEVLHGELDSYINVPGGFVQGRGAEGRAGWAVLHVAPEEWYFYVGTPEDRLGLKIGVGSLSLETGGYFMVGSILPDSPPPPPIVAGILGVDAEELNYMRDENALDSGRGFAFGADLAMDTGDLRFLIFYARFQAGAGFDIMLRNYGEASCSNTGNPVGINGWYANGQAYAYLQGELGIRVKLFFIKKKVPIIKGGAAVLLQTKAPNPVWMRGYVGGHFNVLGGLIKGRFRFKLTIGEECEFENASPLGGLKMITDVTPDDATEDIDVFTIPQATFAMKVGEPIIIPEDEGDKTYRIKLEDYKIIHNGQEIPGVIEWSTYKDRADFVTTDILPPNEQMTVQVKVGFEEQVDGVFRPIMVDGQQATELEERTFTTGGAPSIIPLQNVEYAYPVPNQKYMYENEYDQGYIQLKRGQDYLFEDEQWETLLSYIDEQNNRLEANFIYDEIENKVTYTIPNVYQSNSYRLSIVSEIKGSLNETSGEVSYNNTEIDDAGNNEIQIQNKEAENKSKNEEIERLAYDFSTSKYKTFKQKVNSLNTSDYNWGVIYSDVIYLTNRVKDHEPFDIAELIGTDYTGSEPLVSTIATLDNNYFKQDMNPPLYSNYPLGGVYSIINRDMEEYGIPPVKALPILSTYLTNLEYEVNETMLRTNFPYRYNLGLLYKQDWIDLQSQIVNDYINGLISNGNPVLDFLDEDYLFMRFGFYKIKLQYVLPGGVDRTSIEYKFKNPNKFR